MDLKPYGLYKLASKTKRFTMIRVRRTMLVMMKFSFFLAPIARRRIALEYHAHGKHDGLGAQLQRLIGINGLANYLNVIYSHSELTGVSIHPLDGISTQDQYEKYLEEINFIFRLGDKCSFHAPKILDLEELSLSVIFKSWILALFGQYSLLRITHPYILVDSNPSVYRLANLATARERLDQYSNNPSSTVVIHHRQGVGDFAIQPGQTSSREMQLNRYLVPLEVIRRSVPLALTKVLIYTDAPSRDIDFEPLPGQESAWKSLPGYDGRKVNMKAHSLVDFFTEKNVSVNVETGDNPLEVLSGMAKAEYLILSRSSFGFVAAILNPKATVYIPKDFWHSPLASWIRY